MGVLSYRDDGDKYVIYPTSEILHECQRIFDTRKSGFEPQQVFIVMKISRNKKSFSRERDFLLHIMRIRLCLTGHHTDEGRFIRLAIAFHRKVCLHDVQLPPLVGNKGHVVEFRGTLPGVWEIKVCLSNSGHIHVETMLGKAEKLLEHIKYIDSTDPPF